MRGEGATFIVFGWPAFWWMKHYPRFWEYLVETHQEVVQNEDLVAFRI